MSRDGKIWRIAAGSAILAVFVILGVRLVPLYFRTLELQRFLDATVRSEESQVKPDDLIRIEIANKAAGLGLPVKAGQVGLKRAGGRIRIEVLCVVPVDFRVYVVDLHFRMNAGRL